jgi:hypothetical protein
VSDPWGLAALAEEPPAMADRTIPPPADEFTMRCTTTQTGIEWEDDYAIYRGAKRESNAYPLQRHPDIPWDQIKSVDEGPAWFTKLTDN